MKPVPIDGKTKKSVVDRGLEREKEMLRLQTKGKLGPTMSCVFDDNIQEPLAFLSPEEFKTFTGILTRKRQLTTPSLKLTGIEDKLIKKVRRYRPSLEERKKEEKLIDKLSSQLAPWFKVPEDEKKKMKPEAKKLVERAERELGEEIFLSEGTPDPKMDVEDIDLEMLDDIYEEDSSTTTMLPPLTIDFLDVGMGDSTLFVCGDGTTVLIDCGSHSRIKTGAIDALTFLENRLKELQKIRKLKKPKIDRIYITHADRDHYNLLPTLFHLLPNLQVGEFHIGGSQGQYTAKLDVLKIKQTTGDTLPTIQEILNDWTVVEYSDEYTGKSKHTLTTEPSPSGGPVSFRTLCANSVPKHGEEDTNAASVVVLVEMPVKDENGEPVKILMMGDGEISVENVLVKKHKKAITNCTFLHVGHHGSQIAANEDFLKVVNPRVVQISADQNWAHPYRTTVDRITENPKLRVNEAMKGDEKHPIVVGEGSTKGQDRVHTQIDTNSALIMNISEQRKDTSGSDQAKKAKKDGIEPMVAIGEQWRVVFQEDGSFEKFSTRRDPNVSFL